MLAKLGYCCNLICVLLTAAALGGAATPPDEATALQAQMTKLAEAGKLSEALPLGEKLLALVERTAGPRSTNAVAALEDLAGIHQNLSAHTNAEALYQRAFAILENDHPTNQLAVARVLAGLGSLYIEMSRLDQAESALQRALQIRRERLPPMHADLGTSYSFLGWLHIKRGDYAESEPFYQKALEIRQQALGLTNADTAGSFNDLGLLYDAMGEFERAEPFYLQSLKIRQDILPPAHPDLGRSYNDLALFYKRKAEYAKAEEFYLRALKVKEATLGPSSATLAVSLNNFGTFYLQLGDYAAAQPLLLRALQIKQQVLKADHPGLALAYHNLGLLYESAGQLDLAEAYYQRDVEISERALGTNHVETAISIAGLGGLFYLKHDYERAEAAYLRALRIEERVLKPDHPFTATALHNLARVYLETGDYGRAEPLYERALRIRERVLGSRHPDTAKTLENLARLRLESGDRAGALPLALRAAEANEAVLADILSFTSEQQRLAYQQSGDPYSLLADLGAAEPLAKAVLSRKGVVLDSLLEDHLLATASTNEEVSALSGRLRTTRHKLSRLILSTPTENTPEALKRRDSERSRLEEESERIESKLTRLVTTCGVARRALSVTTKQVQEALPQRSALVEFLRYSHFAGKGRVEPRFGAVVLTKEGEAKWVGLGAAEPIEKDIRRFQHLVRGISDDQALADVLHALYREVWAPVGQAFPRGTKTVFISPDGELNLLSFATLMSPPRRFLALDYTLCLVASGRDLVSPSRKPVGKHLLAIYANPDFGARVSLPLPSPAGVARLRSPNLRGFRDMTFSPLPGAEKEARLLAARSGELGMTTVTLRLGQEATESELNHLAAPYVLHMATHGFVLQGPDSFLERPTNEVQIGQARLESNAQANPMRRSGLALAGAQQTVTAWANGHAMPPENDGIVSAEEVAGLNLSGTWLVVLSACDTGLGQVRAGEGVLGLRRGFLRAGAQNVLLTLWPIDDDQTSGIIVDFYRKACPTGDAPRAFAEVQRNWLRKLTKEKGLLEACRIAGPFVLSFQGKP